MTFVKDTYYFYIIEFLLMAVFSNRDNLEVCVLARSSPNTADSWELTVWGNPWPPLQVAPWPGLGAASLHQGHSCSTPI